ncbi:hypothetical protein [Streptomyces sp. NPDC058434]|uniref:hypothetical protein n=1 Tax=Streptomyces sp. NPDC058434 TaxID=3346498 RepID=UPI00365D8212
MITPDSCTPEGEAILDLAEEMDELQARTGEWPGTDTVNILSGWLSGFSFAATEVTPPQVAGVAWVLRQWDRHSDEVTLWSDKASAVAWLAVHVRSSWDNVAGTDGVPYRPPADDQLAVDLYYGPKEDRGDADYSLYAADIGRYLRKTPTPHDFRFPGAEVCAEVNSAAVFHPQGGPDGEGLPCVEVAGVLVFAYLDADMQAVRVSVHLDTADERLVQSEETVPLHVEVEDSTVFSAGIAPRRTTAEGWWKRLWHLVRRVRWLREA